MQTEQLDEEGVTEVASLADRANLGIVRISPAGEFVTVNDGFATLTGYGRAELRGRSVRRVFPNADIESLVASLLDHVDNGEPAVVTAVVPLQTKASGVVPFELQLNPFEPGTDDEGFVGTARQITSGRDVASVQVSSPWEQSFLSLAEAIPDGMVVIDTDSNVLYANPAVESILGHRPENLVGGSTFDIISPRLRENHLAALDRYLDTGERNIDWSNVELPGQHADGHEIPLDISFNDFVMDGERYFVGLFRDITPQKEAEAEAVQRVHQQETIARLGRYALETTSEEELLHETADLLAEILDADISTVLELDAEAGILNLCAANGLPEELVGTVELPATGPNTLAGYTLDSEAPVVVSDLETETRFDPPEQMLERDLRSGISVVVGSPDDPWGVITAFDTQPQEFAEADVHAVQSLANVLASAIERHERTQQIESQRAQLDAVTKVYRVVQDIQQAVVTQSTREEIEQTVCDRLVDLGGYKFAWIGRIELSEQTFHPHAYAGNEDEYLDEITVTATDKPRGRGPIGRALKAHETQIVSEIATDRTFEPWREEALAHGYRSVASIPLAYEQTTFGILTVYAGERDAFGPEVKEVFDTLGELLGHAIMAVTQRQALHSDTVTEVELRIDGITEHLGFDANGMDTIRFNRVIPIGDDRFVMYASTPASSEDIGDLEALDTIESVSIVSDDGDERRIEIRWSEPPVSSLVSAFGGRTRNGVLRDDAAIVTVELPPTVEVKTLAEQLESNYPDMEVSLQQRTTREPGSLSNDTDDDPFTSLTERQRDALEAAYFSGYFEWPRDNSANDIADAMDISGPTYHQHLRGAEQRIFTWIFENIDQLRE